MKSTPDPLEVRRLAWLACDGLLDEQGLQELEAILEAHPELIEDYTAVVTTDALIEIKRGRSVLDQLPMSPVVTKSVDHVGSSRDGAHVAPHSRRSSPRSWRTLCLTFAPYALAALVLLGFTLFLFSRPAARIVAVDETVWSDGEEREAGASVNREWLELTEGEVQLSFRSGAMIAVRAPARFQASAPRAMELGYGVVSAHVPESALGFQVQTPKALVTDLGTGFRLDAARSGELGVQVTDGRVRLEYRSRSQEVQLEAGQTALVSPSGDSVSVQNAPALRMSRNVTFYSEHPDALGYNAFDRDDSIALFVESSRIRLPRDLRVNVTETGRHEQLSGVGGILAEGKVVSCYLIHCAPQRKRHVVEGSITFPGPVLGLVCDSDSLNATNSLLGATWTLKCGHPERGLESAPDRNSDVVVISPDRRTLSLGFRTESIDQLRVLVAEDH